MDKGDYILFSILLIGGFLFLGFVGHSAFNLELEQEKTKRAEMELKLKQLEIESHKQVLDPLLID